MPRHSMKENRIYKDSIRRTLDGYTGVLTREDIENGIEQDCLRCPIALVLQRMFPEQSIAVDDTHAEICDKDGNEVVSLVLSHEIQDWMMNFDDSQPVPPICIILRKIGTIWMLCKTYPTQTPITYHPIPESVEVLVTFENDEPFGTEWTGAIGENGRLDHVVDGGGRYFFTMEELYAHGVRRLHIQNSHEVEVDLIQQ